MANNKIETTQITFMDEKVTCARFTINDTSIPFVFKNIATKEKDYTFSLYLKSAKESSITVEGCEIPSTTAWERQHVIFTASKENVEVVFNNVGTYYFYHTQLEIGKICSDWTPNPDDLDEDLLDVRTIAEQTADKFKWLVKSGTNESNFEITDRVISLISKNINLDGIVTFMNTAEGKEFGGNVYATTGYADFENIADTDISYAKTSDITVAIDSSTAYHGSKSLKISSPAKDSAKKVYLGNSGNGYGCIKVYNGKTYQLTAYVKSDSSESVLFGIDWATHGTEINNQAGTCYIESYLFSQRPSSPKGVTTITPSTEWQRAITTFTVNDSTNDYYYISVVPTLFSSNSSDINIWVDAIMFEEVDSLNATPSEFSAEGKKRTIIDGGSILTETITAEQLSANSITAEKIMTDALKSRNYVSGTSGSFLNLADGSFDSRYLKWDSEGKLSATRGTIAKWNINSDSIYKGNGWKSSQGGSAYFGDNGLSIMNKFWVDSSGNANASNIHITGGTLDMGGGNLVLDSNGNATLIGKIIASSGNVAGWDISSEELKNEGDDYAVYICPGTNDHKDFLTVWDKKKASGDEYPFYVHADGWMHCVYGDIGGWNISSDKLYKEEKVGDITRLFSLSPSDKNLSIKASGKTQQDEDIYYPTGEIVLGVKEKEDTYWPHIKMNLSDITCQSGTASIELSPIEITIINQLFEDPSKTVLEAGKLSFYPESSKNPSWEVQVDTDGARIKGETYFSNIIHISTDKYIFTTNKSGSWQSLLGLSSGNNIWLGDYGYAGTSKKQVATNAYIVANNIYKTTSSGSTSLSDERYKHGFKDINNATDFIMNLAPCLFKFNDGTSNRYHMGFKAQEVEKNMLNTVGDTGLTVKYNCEEGLEVDLDNPDTYMLGLRYEEFIAPLIQVVQEQQKRISELERKIATSHK